jgi:glycosyltransferase involved in cell wall biosynthesis
MYPTLLVFADDWGRHPSSCQHLIHHLLDRYQVIWVNTIGTRTPRLSWSTVTRGFEKLRHWSRRPSGSSVLPANLRVVSPKMWPWFGSRFSRKLNLYLLRRQLRPLLEAPPGPTVAITTLPIVCDLIGELHVERWVYYCVDDFSLWPGLDQRTLLAMDEDLIRKADVIVSVSENLQSRVSRLGRESSLLTHGVDQNFWQSPASHSEERAWDSREQPLVVFWGAIDRRMDVSVVRQLSFDLQKGTVALVGPLADPDPALLEIPRVTHIPPLPFDQLPMLAQAASVLIMPYADLPVTQAIQPLKLKEYLATGKPVVVADLPANRPWADCLDLAASPEAFSKAVLERLAAGIPQTQVQARARLAEESWTNKAKLFEQALTSREALRNGDGR